MKFDEDNYWKDVSEYLESHAAWEAMRQEIWLGEEPIDDRMRRFEEAGTDRPNFAPAFEAAWYIVREKSDRAVDAAVFILEHTTDSTPEGKAAHEYATAALQELIGPDWSIVESYREEVAAHDEEIQSIENSDIPDSRKKRLRDELGERPKGTVATAIALQIAEQNPDHEYSREAAEYLIDSRHMGSRTAIRGAWALAKLCPDHDQWPRLLSHLNVHSVGESDEQIGEFFAEFASKTEDPLARALARFYRATDLARELNVPSLSSKDREQKRVEALESAIGLSAGVEEEPYPGVVEVGMSRMGQPLAETEADLVHLIRHASTGATVADETGNRLDGAEDRLSAYLGRVVLVDFWGTWCGPCRYDVPQLRDLAAAYSDGRLAILSISDDEDVETVKAFMVDEPMPWTHWCADQGLLRRWFVELVPTYVVIAPDGKIVCRELDLDDTKEVLTELLDTRAA